MNNPNDPTLERHANAALTGLIFMTAGTFALMVQNLRGLIDVLGVGALRVALIALAVAAVLAFLAKTLTVLGDNLGVPEGAGSKLLLILLGLIGGSILSYGVFLMTIVISIREPIVAAGH